MDGSRALKAYVRGGSMKGPTGTCGAGAAPVGAGDWARARRGLRVNAAAPKPKVFNASRRGIGVSIQWICDVMSCDFERFLLAYGFDLAPSPSKRLENSPARPARR